MMFDLTTAQKRLGNSVVVERYSVTGLSDCFSGNHCQLSLRDFQLKLGTNGNIVVPQATLKIDKSNDHDIMFLHIAAGVNIKISPKIGGPISILMQPDGDVLIKLHTTPLGLDFLIMDQLSASIRIDNQLLGFIKDAKISGLVVGASALDTMSEEQKLPADTLAYAQDGTLRNLDLEMNLRLKIFDYVELSKKSLINLDPQEKDGMPMKIVYKMQKEPRRKNVDAQILASTFGLNADLNLEKGLLSGVVQFSSWREMLDEITNAVVHLAYESDQKLTAEEVLACYASLYNKIFPALMLAQHKSHTDKSQDLFVDLETKNGKLFLNGLEFDLLFNR